MCIPKIQSETGSRHFISLVIEGITDFAINALKVAVATAVKSDMDVADAMKKELVKLSTRLILNMGRRHVL